MARGQGSDGRVTLAVRGNGAGHCRDGLWQLDGSIAKAQTDSLGTDLDVLGGQAADR
ncbi:hypothetical protein Pve01_74280 [Planomonospora venezuelensis]|nr:hypothetical protein Pve01_74280 [Planomonospora venezuelensis]